MRYNITKKEEKIHDMYKTYTIAFEREKLISIHISEQHSHNEILPGG